MSSHENQRRTFVIFNPASGRGAGAKRIDLYLDLLRKRLPEFEHAITSRPREESELAAQAVADGFELIVAVGGDGTWSNVADRLVSLGNPSVALGLLPSGTGNDFGRNFGISPRSPADAVDILARGVVTETDVGRVVSAGAPLGDAADQTTDESPVTGRHFLNLVGFGFDVAVIEDTAGAHFLRGELLYKVTALKNLFSFKGVAFELMSDEPGVDGDHLMLTISNAPFFGGGFLIAPSAELNDGLLDACAIGDSSPFSRMRLFSVAPKGGHVTSPLVHTRKSPRFTVRFADPPKYEVDGELWQAQVNEVHIEVVPAALRIVVPG
jgi:YegS/Rv2252/BmrU family lipid kinase